MRADFARYLHSMNLRIQATQSGEFSKFFSCRNIPSRMRLTIFFILPRMNNIEIFLHSKFLKNNIGQLIIRCGIGVKPSIKHYGKILQFCFISFLSSQCSLKRITISSRIMEAISSLEEISIFHKCFWNQYSTTSLNLSPTVWFIIWRVRSIPTVAKIFSRLFSKRLRIYKKSVHVKNHRSKHILFR